MTSANQTASLRSGSSAPAAFTGPRDVLDLWSTLVRGRRLIFSAALITTLLAIGYLFVEKPLYEGDAQIIIDTSTSRAMQSKGVGGGADIAAEAIDNNLVDSEVEVLSSDGFGEEVIRALGLQNDPEFVGRPQRFFPKMLSYVAGAVSSAKSLLGKADVEDDPVQRWKENILLPAAPAPGCKANSPKSANARSQPITQCRNSRRKTTSSTPAAASSAISRSPTSIRNWCSPRPASPKPRRSWTARVRRRRTRPGRIRCPTP
jgi:hypothetical protein